jgi:hypothetical protein
MMTIVSINVCRAARPDPFLFAVSYACARRHICLGAGTVWCYPNFGSNFLWTNVTALRQGRRRSAHHTPAFAPDIGKYPSIAHLLHPQPTTITTAYYTGNPVPNKRLTFRIPAKPGTSLQAKC